MRVAGSAGHRRDRRDISAISAADRAVPGVERAAMADAPLPGFAGVEFSIIGRADDAATLSRAARELAHRQPRVLRRAADPDRDRPVVCRRRHAERHAGRDRQRRDGATATGRVENPIGRQIRSGEGPRATVATDGRRRRQCASAAGARGAAADLCLVLFSRASRTSRCSFDPRLESACPPKPIKQAIWSVVPGAAGVRHPADGRGHRAGRSTEPRVIARVARRVGDSGAVDVHARGLHRRELCHGATGRKKWRCAAPSARRRRHVLRLLGCRQWRGRLPA